MAYPNLNAELARIGMTHKQLADRIGRPHVTVNNWMIGRTSVPVSDCFRIKDELFPELSVDYLFASEPIVVSQ